MPDVEAVYGAAEAERAAALIRDRLDIDDPHIGIILGSGLGGVASSFARSRRLPFGDIPGFPPPRVEGHEGSIVAGELGGRRVVAVAGRFHIYEGYRASHAGFPARVLHALGAPRMLVSNAAGAVRDPLRPGDLMIIADHINLMWRNPLAGAVQPGDGRFPDMSSPYDESLRALLRGALLAAELPIREGVYAGATGPAYETPAEIRMLDKLGADAVGMSTVPEVVVARAFGMKVAGLSCITNYAAGRSLNRLSHDEVIETARLVEDRVAAVVAQFVSSI